MTRLFSSIALAAALLVSTGQAAWAGAFHYRAASGDIPSSSNCSRQFVNVPAAAPYTAMRCTTAGGSFDINTVYPTDATSAGLTPRLRWINPDSGAADGYCLNVCFAVIKGGQSRNAAVFTCSFQLLAYAGFPVLAQNNVVDTGMSPVTPGIFPAVIPLDTTGTACTPSSCAGAEMIVQVVRANVSGGGQCSLNNSAQSIDFQSLSVLYQ